jgi:uncharacterized protein (TIGR00290 family)
MTERRAGSVVLSWSSGKDAAWALELLRRDGWAVAALLTTLNEAFDRVAMHGTRRTIVEAQAERVGLPIEIVPLPWPCPNEEYERRMRDVTTRLVANGFTHVAFGDIALEDVREYRERSLEGSGLAPLFPLWGRDTLTLSHEMVDAGLDAWIVTLDPRRLDPAFAGRRYDTALLDALPADVDPCGERGEFHTCVVDGPMFSAPVVVAVGETITREGFVYTDLRLAAGN